MKTVDHGRLTDLQRFQRPTMGIDPLGPHIRDVHLTPLMKNSP